MVESGLEEKFKTTIYGLPASYALITLLLMAYKFIVKPYCCGA